MVDEVCEVLRLARADLRPAPAVTGAAGSGLFLGICGGEGGSARAGRRGDTARLRLLLNVKALLDPAARDGVEAGRALLEAPEDA
jgi:purine-binding chemotaxis protein CheW